MIDHSNSSMVHVHYQCLGALLLQPDTACWCTDWRLAHTNRQRSLPQCACGGVCRWGSAPCHNSGTRMRRLE